ncbi:hypothetical protein EG240_11720 [Paenimyroides tangerinum]|uniref:Type I restriction modification DNA specificity domain-containing protein n=1 Tax=Paenimyroides tangerinum TaxID=2488728 RepID=A0A3P3W714_9FLAO|nr:restriction endonuclease subunit S [Paenimyroides tangerinum]RRJ89409.1 hypothetical protein EG240_11720 [Paenimyroides tangerinum]
MGYKFTYKSLAELCQINLGKTPSRNKPEYWGEGVNWVSISDLKDKYISNTKEQITEEAITGANCKIVKKGTLLMSFKLSIGKLAFTEIDLFTNEAIAALPIIDESILDKDYLYYVLKFIPLVGGNQAVMGKTLNKQSLSNLQIPLPPTIDDQKRIAKVLSDCEVLIQKRKQSIELLDEFIQATFLDMFGDPVFSEVNLFKLKDISTKIGSGATPKGGNESYKSSGISLIRSLNIHNNFFKTKDLAFIDDVQASKLNNVIVEKDDLLFNITGASVCRCAIVPEEILPARVNQHVSIIRVNKEIVNPIYLCHLLLSVNFKKFLLQIANQNGATREAITKEQLENILVPIANYELQLKFVDKILSIENLKVKLNKSYNELQNLFESLSQRAFKGQLDLSKVDISAMDDEKKKPSSEVTDETIKSEEKQIEDRNKIIEKSKEVENDGSYLIPDLHEYIEQSKEALSKVNAIIRAGSEDFNSLESDLELVDFAGSLVVDHINTLTPLQVYQHSYVERYAKHLPQELIDKYPNINLFSRREFDYSTMSLEEYLGVPDDVVAEYGNIGNDAMYLHFFFRKYFSDKSFTIDEVEELYNRIVYDDGDWFKYKPMKKFIFEAMKGDDAFITQVFEEQIDPDNIEIPKKLIKLKLIE